MNRLPASQRYKHHTGRWKRHEKQRPGHYAQIDAQIDAKFIVPIAAGSDRRKRYYRNHPAVVALPPKAVHAEEWQPNGDGRFNREF
jgi:hypothetical protein